MPPTADTTPREWYCNCAKYCRGRQREVSESTHRNHARYRNQRLKEALGRALGTGHPAQATGQPSARARRRRRRTPDNLQPGPSSVGGSFALPRNDPRKHSEPWREISPVQDDPLPFQDAELEPPQSHGAKTPPRGSSPPGRPRARVEDDVAEEEPEFGSNDPTGTLPEPTLEELTLW
ncbi:hypothetical protein BD309DRAFT_234784 [Dichomitus squalens]|nr:hypothetical protein BD309DRAFT_234784 [Dichomitus squalens]